MALRERCGRGVTRTVHAADDDSHSRDIGAERVGSAVAGSDLSVWSVSVKRGRGAGPRRFPLLAGKIDLPGSFCLRVYTIVRIHIRSGAPGR